MPGQGGLRMPVSTLHQSLHRVTARSPPTLGDHVLSQYGELSFPVLHSKQTSKLLSSTGKSYTLTPKSICHLPCIRKDGTIEHVLTYDAHMTHDHERP